MMARTVKEVDDGMEVVELVKKVSVGWRVEWSEERYTREEESEESLTMDKDEVRIYFETRVTLECKQGTSSNSKCQIQKIFPEYQFIFYTLQTA